MIRIFYDDDRGSLFIDGVKQVFPPRTLKAAAFANNITVAIANDIGTIVGPVPFDWIADKGGSTFASAGLAVAYLEQEFSKSPAGIVLDAPDFVSDFEASL